MKGTHDTYNRYTNTQQNIKKERKREKGEKEMYRIPS